ncbi:SAM-dependent methyltransferase [Microbacterium sp. G2-8]|uniref:SAM-dependent methyltransferase n=1 Tax=Microbacterium sp. G2-8 TaxID=2842454 RepID=UPI001C89A4E2|nr:SAM-dependent methyltransferase [Microbacterium sp. G2-8]
MPPFALHEGSPLSVAELSAARLDGDIVAVGRNAYAAVDQPHNDMVRANVARPVIPAGFAAVGRTAAWIHGALQAEPDPHHAQRLESTPAKRHWATGVVLHDWPLPEVDTVSIARVTVATIERTFYDVARASFADADDALAATALRTLLAREDLADPMLAWLEQGRRLRFTHTLARLIRQSG